MSIEVPFSVSRSSMWYTGISRPSNDKSSAGRVSGSAVGIAEDTMPRATVIKQVVMKRMVDLSKRFR